MSEFVSVPVPVDRVQEVYRLLASQPKRTALGPQVTENGYPDGWSQALIERMFVESSSAMRRILHALAERSPHWTTTGADSRGLGFDGPAGRSVAWAVREARTWPVRNETLAL